MLSAPYARLGTGRGHGSYGGRVCTIKVSVMGSRKHMLEVEQAFGSAQLTNLQLHHESNLNKGM